MAIVQRKVYEIMIKTVIFFITTPQGLIYTFFCLIVLPNIRQVVEHWLLRHPEHADNPERSLVLAKSDGARCPFGFLDQRAA